MSLSREFWIGVLFVSGVGALFVTFDSGVERGKKLQLAPLWENPPDMAYCVVYPDGGKRCVANAVPEPIGRTECIRQCVARDRLGKTK